MDEYKAAVIIVVIVVIAALGIKAMNVYRDIQTAKIEGGDSANFVCYWTESASENFLFVVECRLPSVGQ